MAILSTIILLADGLKLVDKAFRKMFQDTLSISLVELFKISSEHEQLANCLLETVEAKAIKVEDLPEKDEYCLNELIEKVKSSKHFKNFCDTTTYTDEKLKEAVVKFLEIFENNLTKDQNLFNRLQLQYKRVATRKLEEIKSQFSSVEHKLNKVLAFIPSEENVRVERPLDERTYQSKYLDSVFALGLEVGNNGKFRKALRKYQEFINAKNSHSHRKYFAVLNNMAAAYFGLRNHKKAFEYAQKAHKVAPRKSLAVLNLAVACFYLRRLDQALQFAQKAKGRRGNDPNVYNTLSILYAERGERQKAYKLINEAISKDKKFAIAYVNRAILRTQMRKFDQALNDLSTAIKLQPEDGDFYVNLGVIYQKRFLATMDAKVVPLGTKADIHYILSDKLDKLTEEQNALLEKARESYEKALELGVKIPENSTLGVNLADCYYIRKEYKKAEKIYKQVKVDDERHYPYQGLGDVYFWTRRFRKALSCYRKLIELHGESAHVYNWIARALAELADYGAAIGNLNKAIELEPDNPMYKTNLRLIYEMTKRLREGQEAFENLKESGRDLGSVCFHLGYLYFRQRMFASAKQELLAARQSGVSTRELSEMLVDSAYYTDDIVLAKQELKHLLSRHSDNFTYNLNYAKLLDLESRHSEAKKHYLKALLSREALQHPRHLLLIQRRLQTIDMPRSCIVLPGAVRNAPRQADLLIRHARQLVTLRGNFPGPRAMHYMQDPGVIEDGAVAVSEGRIVGVGKTKDVLDEIKINDKTKVVDAKDKVVLPGFVDCHTHPVFAHTREDEFEMRIKGKTYQEIAGSGGGIKSSVKNLRAKSKEELIQLALPRLDRMLSYGTTTIEAKSGYGLSLEDEIKMLEVIKELNKIHPIDLIPTFLGAHEIPEEYKNNREEYIKLITEKMVPEVAKRKLAVFCDVFCEKGVFDVEESREVLKAAKDHGFRLKLHADQLSALEGSKLAAELGAISADHLEFIDDDGIDKMKESGVIGVLLPGACFGLGMKEYPPARKMIERGLPVALATDFNPGSSMTESMPMILSLACLMMRMTPAEAIVASTINSAYAVDKANETGSIEKGKKADLVIWNVQNYKEIPYHFGVNLVDQVIKDGKVFPLPLWERARLKIPPKAGVRG